MRGVGGRIYKTLCTSIISPPSLQNYLPPTFPPIIYDHNCTLFSCCSGKKITLFCLGVTMGRGGNEGKKVSENNKGDSNHKNEDDDQFSMDI